MPNELDYVGWPAAIVVIIWVALLIVPLAVALRSAGHREDRRSTNSEMDQEADASWIVIEERFQQSPHSGVWEAERLVGRLVHARDPDIGLLEEYHIARAIALKSQRGAANLEELDEAMETYHMLIRRLSAPSLTRH